jgi:hypothetical protein
LVVDALESWAAGEAARIMVSLFLVAGVLTVIAIPPALALGSRTETGEGAVARERARLRLRTGRDGEESEPTFAA